MKTIEEEQKYRTPSESETREIQGEKGTMPKSRIVPMIVGSEMGVFSLVLSLSVAEE
jgi:hypothetical protein